MPDEQDDPFDENGDEALDEFDRLTELLFQHVLAFAEEEEVGDETLSPLLLRLSLTSRMVAYAASAAKPSGAGLKLDLDRFRRDIENLIRETKKDADGFIAQARESIVAAELDEDEAEPNHFNATPASTAIGGIAPAQEGGNRGQLRFGNFDQAARVKRRMAAPLAGGAGT